MARGSRKGRKPRTPRTIDLKVTPVVEEVEPVADDTPGSVDVISDDAPEELSEFDEIPAGGTGGEPVSSEKPESKRGGGATMVGVLVAAVLGGAIALGGAGALNQAGLLKYVPFASGLIYGGDNKKGADADALAVLDTKIAGLAAQVERLASVNGTSGQIPAEISDRIAALETELVKLQQLAASDAGEAAKAALDAAQNAAREAAKSADIANSRVDEALAKVSELSQKIISGGSAVDAEMVKSALANETSALGARLDTLEANYAEIKTHPKVGEQLTALSAKISELATSVESFEAVEGNLAKQLDRIDLTISGAGSRIDAIEEKIKTDIMAPMSEVQDAAKGVLVSQKLAGSVSARAMMSAIEHGGSFSGELAAAEALLGPNETITALKPIAASGVMTEAQLLANFGSVRDAIESAENAPAADAGVVAKLFNNAKSLVTVRTIGPQAGDNASAIASRIEASLKAGDLVQARAEWETLPTKAKALSKSWVETLNKRLVGQELVAKLVDALSGSAGADENAASESKG